MKTNNYFKSSLIVATSGLSASLGHAATTTIDHNVTLNPADAQVSFDITGDATDDYAFLFAGNNAQKPQITTANFDSGGINQIFLPDSQASVRTLPVLSVGQVVDANLFGGNTFEEAFFYQNWDANHYGDWGGTPAGASAPDPIQGPISGYVGLAIPASTNLVDFNYGYAQFTVDVRDHVNGNSVITLLKTAFETDLNTPITIVPEPSVAALVMGALGVVGLRLRRARRQ